MSVLIDGMEIPKDHVRVLVLHPDGRVIDEWGNAYQASLLPPHGDLVDRAEMREITISLLDEAVTDQEANAIREMWSRLGQMPVYIPAEEGE